MCGHKNDTNITLIARANNLRYGKEKSNKNFDVPESHQQTVIFHVDDLQVSHIDPSENTKFAEHLKVLYNREYLKPITIHSGTVHDYLGVDYDYGSEPGTVKVSQIKYVDKILDDFPQEVGGPLESPAAPYLFDIRPDDDTNKTNLSETESQHYHHAVAVIILAIRLY